MKTHEAINQRVSTREFSNKDVKFDAILEAIDSANQTPFAGNINNLKFILIETEENKKYIAEFSQQYWISDAKWIIVVCSELGKLESLYQDRADMYARQQAGAAIQNILLSLTDQEISSCWVGAFSENEIKVKLKVPEKFRIEAIIPVGHSKTKKPKKSRKAPLDGKIFWEKWNQNKKPMKYPNADPSTS